MPKLGMKAIRQSQLIEATLKSIETYGLSGTTIGTISRNAGVSTGIINHYFGGKQGLLDATVRFLLRSLHDELMIRLRKVQPDDPMGRLEAIVGVNFAKVHVSDKGSKTWLAFWSESMHSPEFARLQKVNERRLLSNLKYSYRQLLPEAQVEEAAQTTAAVIDGHWLRRALSDQPLPKELAEQYCMNFVRATVHNAKNA